MANNNGIIDFWIIKYYGEEEITMDIYEKALQKIKEDEKCKSNWCCGFCIGLPDQQDLLVLLGLKVSKVSKAYLV